jgi:hypothetical protein
MRGSRTTAVVIGAVVAIAAAGCGGDGDDTSATTAALSKDEFVTQANEICAKGSDEIDAAAADVFGGGSQPSPEEGQQFITETVIPTIQGEIDDIKALGAPAGDEEQVTAILDAAQQGVDAGKADPSVLEGGQQNDPFAESDKLAKAYGLTECAGG